MTAGCSCSGSAINFVCTFLGQYIDERNRDYSIFTGFWYGSRKALVVECWLQHASTEDRAMLGPGVYRPDPTEGMTAIANVPPPEIVPASRTYMRQACPRCGYQA